MLLEELEEICYLNLCQNQQYHTIVYRKTIGLIAHGTQPMNAAPYYKTALLDPLALAFTSIQMRVVGVDEQQTKGVAFGIKKLSIPSGEMFVPIKHDGDEIRDRLRSLVKNILEQATL
jgi:hypothetical protein